MRPNEALKEFMRRDRVFEFLIKPEPPELERPFLPALVQSTAGQHIPPEHLSTDTVCGECHADILQQTAASMHRLSSFNNPAYRFSVRGTREVLQLRSGDDRAARFCAGCHDLVPLFSGAFDDPRFDDPEFALASDATAQAGITCTVCHSISHVNSPRGNADYTIDEPVHYPFAFSDNAFLKAVNRMDLFDSAMDVDGDITFGLSAVRNVGEAVVEQMKAGAVIIDLAAESGGNCELTVPGEAFGHERVMIYGPLNVPAMLPVHASEMYAKNLYNFLSLIIRDGQVDPDWDDEIVASATLTHGGEIRHEPTRQAVEAAS